MSLKAEDFPAQTAALKARVASGEPLEAVLPEAFALAREAGRRVLGERAFDTQMMGGIVLHDGRIVEMKTGEGKTLSSVSASYLNSLEGKGVHVVTVNDYLAERDSQWMGSIYSYLGVSVGAILSNMDNDARREAYARDITYGTNNEFGFDYLRDNMAMEPSMRVQRGHHYCVVDEIDSILVDEARTPLIISGAAEDDTYKINEVFRLCPQLVEVQKDPATGEYPKEEEGETLNGDYKIEEKNKKVSFTSDGLATMETATYRSVASYRARYLTSRISSLYTTLPRQSRRGSCSTRIPSTLSRKVSCRLSMSSLGAYSTVAAILTVFMRP
ncbi:hypothetical protein MASR2M48_27610 [Spirochaetota bacterium]